MNAFVTRCFDPLRDCHLFRLFPPHPMCKNRISPPPKPCLDINNGWMSWCGTNNNLVTVGLKVHSWKWKQHFNESRSCICHFKCTVSFSSSCYAKQSFILNACLLLSYLINKNFDLRQVGDLICLIDHRQQNMTAGVYTKLAFHQGTKEAIMSLCNQNSKRHSFPWSQSQVTLGQMKQHLQAGSGRQLTLHCSHMTSPPANHTLSVCLFKLQNSPISPSLPVDATAAPPQYCCTIFPPHHRASIHLQAPTGPNRSLHSDEVGA